MGANFVQLGYNVRKFRKAKKMSQEKLADITGYTTSHICHIENAVGIPSFEALTKIADALGVSLDQLAYGVINNTDGYFIREMIEMTGQFSNHHKKLIQDITLSLVEHISKFII